MDDDNMNELLSKVLNDLGINRKYFFIKMSKYLQQPK